MNVTFVENIPLWTLKNYSENYFWNADDQYIMRLIIKTFCEEIQALLKT